LSDRTIPDRYRPDRSGVIIQPYANNVVQLVQVRPRAARTADVRQLVEDLADAGFLLYITYEGPGEPEHWMHASRKRWPTLPTSVEEVLALMDPHGTLLAQIVANDRFKATGESQLWLPKAG
jgi:uncharacterized radical SAM superfamily Fe-S cluster-containing enzyme